MGSRVQGEKVLKNGDVAVNIGDRFCEKRDGVSLSMAGRGRLGWVTWDYLWGPWFNVEYLLHENEGW